MLKYCHTASSTPAPPRSQNTSSSAIGAMRVHSGSPRCRTTNRSNHVQNMAEKPAAALSHGAAIAQQGCQSKMRACATQIPTVTMINPTRRIVTSTFIHSGMRLGSLVMVVSLQPAA